MKSIIILALLVSACSPQLYWYKPDISREQFAKDEYSCERDVRSANYPVDLSFAVEQQQALQDMFVRCMQSKGYYLRHK